MPIRIPIRNRSQILAAADAYADANNPRVERWLHNVWNAQSDSMRLEEIMSAMNSGDINTAWLERWRKEYFDFVNDKLGPQWKDAISTNGENTIAGLNKAMKLRQPLIWTDETAAISKWIDNSGAQFLTRSTLEQRQAISTLIHQFTVNQPMSAPELARVLRASVGLNGPQAASVAKLRQTLLDEGLSPAVVKQKINEKIVIGIRDRATMIAQTEQSFAWHEGQDQAMRQAVEQGAFNEDQFVVKVWLCNPGCCVFCQAVDGLKRPLDGTYATDARTGREIKRPPYHPRCICTQYHEIVTEEEYNAIMSKLSADGYISILAGHYEIKQFCTGNLQVI